MWELFGTNVVFIKKKRSITNLQGKFNIMGFVPWSSSINLEVWYEVDHMWSWAFKCCLMRIFDMIEYIGSYAGIPSFPLLCVYILIDIEVYPVYKLIKFVKCDFYTWRLRQSYMGASEGLAPLGNKKNQYFVSTFTICSSPPKVLLTYRIFEPLMFYLHQREFEVEPWKLLCSEL